MDPSDKFGLYLTSIIALGILSIITIFVVHDTLVDRRIADLIRSGTPANEALCAMRPSYSGCTTRNLENE